MLAHTTVVPLSISDRRVVALRTGPRTRDTPSLPCFGPLAVPRRLTARPTLAHPAGNGGQARDMRGSPRPNSELPIRTGSGGRGSLEERNREALYVDDEVRGRHFVGR